jgi:hypothetical protein
MLLLSYHKWKRLANISPKQKKKEDTSFSER